MEVYIFLGIFFFLTFIVVNLFYFFSKKYNNHGRSNGRISGYVYIISNPSFKKNIYKIGMTKRTVKTRIAELFTTGVPTPFVVEMKIAHKKPEDLEKYLHMKFHKLRINKRREFFLVPLSTIRAELNHLNLLWCVKEDLKLF